MLAAACGGQTPPQGHDAGPGQDAVQDSASPGDAPAPVDGPPQADAAAQEDGPAATDGPVQTDTGTGGTDGGTYRNSLSICWTDATCQRVMSVAHGGAWEPLSLTLPYLSNAAIVKAYDLGIDGVKIDVRVTSDNVPVLAHSSPIEPYESVLCSGWKIEEKTAAEVTGCVRAPSFTEHFQRLDEVLTYLRGKMVTQLCVKRSVDYQRTIQEIHALGAEDFAFIELGSAAELQTIIPTLTGADTVWYLVNVADRVAEVDTLIDVIQNPRAFMYEFDPTIDVSSLTPNRLHPAGVRSFTYDSAATLSVAKTQQYFEGGYDVVSSQSAANNVQARKNVNTARGISPP